MVSPKVLSKLLPGDCGSIGGVTILIRFPPILSFSLELSKSKQHLLPVITLCNIELLFYSTKPIIGFQRISGMCEHWGTTLQKFTTLITWLCPSNWLILLVLHQLLHKLRLHYQQLLNT
jgi:hypothetical protein